MNMKFEGRAGVPPTETGDEGMTQDEKDELAMSLDLLKKVKKNKEEGLGDLHQGLKEKLDAKGITGEKAEDFAEAQEGMDLLAAVKAAKREKAARLQDEITVDKKDLAEIETIGKENNFDLTESIVEEKGKIAELQNSLAALGVEVEIPIGTTSESSFHLDQEGRVKTIVPDDVVLRRIPIAPEINANIRETEGEDMMNCPKCGSLIPFSSNFCTQCGKKQEIKVEEKPATEKEKNCPKCGATMPSWAEFCNMCGEKQEVREGEQQNQEDKEVFKKTELIKSASDLDSLLGAVDIIGGVQGSREFFEKDVLKKFIQEAFESNGHPDFLKRITNTLGLRDQVSKIINDRK